MFARAPLGLCVALSAAALGCSAEPADLGPLSQDDLSIAEIVARAEAGDITNVDELLAALPEEQRQSVVLLERSGSSHQADAHHPRMVLFGPDARLVVAVGTLEDDPRFETAELLELDEAEGRFRMAAITFGEDGPTVEGEERCVRCHGQDPRPIWGAYPVWPGAFEGRGEELTETQRVALPAMRGDETHRFRFVADAVDDAYDLEGRSYGHPNTSLNLEIGARVAGALARRAQASPHYERLAPALLALPECGYVEDTEIRDLTVAMGAVVASEAPRAIGSGWEPIYEIWGLDLERDFALGERADQPARERPAQLATWNLGTAYLDDLVRFLVLEDLLAAHPALAGALEGVSAARADILYYGWELRGQERAALLAEPDVAERAYLDPQSRVMSAALGDIDGSSPERLAFCRRLGELWDAGAR